MRKVIVNEWMALDGVVQAPGVPDEDESGGFEHGGWHLPYFDEASQKGVLENLALLQGDVAEAVGELRQGDGGDLHVIGSADLVQTLLANDLVDEFRFMIDPLVLGAGRRIFHEEGARRPLRLVDSQVTTTGAILATFAPVVK
jgi:dihydrofolate reductase